jgi:hypothetical protein
MAARFPSGSRSALSRIGLIKGAKPDVVGEGANVARWINAIGARPAVQKGMAVPQV